MELKGLKDFPGRTLETFDFRDLAGNYYRYFYEKDPKGRQGNPNYERVLKAAEKIESVEDPMEKWYLYKVCDEGRSYPFDCDNSRTTCQLASEIYEALWSKKILAFCERKGSFVGDTMNSLLTTLNELAKRDLKEKWWSWERWKERYNKDHEAFKRFFDDHPEVREFAAALHTIGNFIPWPVGCNGPRGVSPQIRDYWDLTLDRIYRWYRENREWLEKPRFPRNNLLVGLFDSQMVNFDQYLTAFGSWDGYVAANYLHFWVEEPGPEDKEYGRPKELWKGHLEKGAPVLPAGDEILEYFKAATWQIKKRSKLMVDALCGEEPVKD